MIARRLGRGAEMHSAEITWAGALMPSTAAYLAAWLAAALHWRELSAARLRLRCSDPLETPAEEGRIRSVHVRGGACALDLDRARGASVGVAVDELHSSAVFPAAQRCHAAR